VVIVELIGATTTRTGLRGRAEPDRGRYPARGEVRDEELAAVPLARHEFHGQWNYTIHRRVESATDGKVTERGPHTVRYRHFDALTTDPLAALMRCAEGGGDCPPAGLTGWRQSLSGERCRARRGGSPCRG
jgi:Rhodopirellula transposase DDE domain